MTPNELDIRPAEAHDLQSLVDIYNHYITETHITFDTEPFAVGARTQWFTQFSTTGPHRLLVGKVNDDIVGYASSSKFNARPAYSTSVETTIYLHPDHVGFGFGAELYGTLLDELAIEPGAHRAYGGVALPNPKSIALHERLGFKRVATYHEVGFKFGKYWDVSWYEKEV
ncbi:MAG: GNAT family N-acetyltransferase [Gammaproteobacteria bacterium]|nr:GNAT family N-acetyltransferase [Gammaproteobacteria bacterium]